MNLERFVPRFFVYLRRVKRLTERGWYVNMAGGVTDRRCMRIISKRELACMSEEEFMAIK